MSDHPEHVDSPLPAPAPEVLVPGSDASEAPLTVGGGFLVAPAPVDADGVKQIQTLPPVDELGDTIPISETTGQPRRDATMIVAGCFLYAASAVAAVGWARAWWRAINVSHWYTSTQMTQWWLPRPGSKESVFIAIAMAVIALLTVAAPALAAFQAWNGYPWSRNIGVVAVALSFLGILMVPVLSWVPIPLTMIGVACLFLPNVSTYFDHWRRFRTVAEPRPAPRREVTYGPLARFR